MAPQQILERAVMRDGGFGLQTTKVSMNMEHSKEKNKARTELKLELWLLPWTRQKRPFKLSQITNMSETLPNTLLQEEQCTKESTATYGTELRTRCISLGTSYGSKRI
eukprot:9996816-Heterocapsa_arctica.AAC.2